MPFEDRYIWGIIALGGIADAPRIFDPTRRAVRFWGHDSAMEWSFFVTEGALKRLQPNVERSEASLLLAFDTHRAAIHAVAITTYKRERKGLL